MKNSHLPHFLSIALISLACAAFAPALQAQVKIGTIDLKKVFDGYYKTKQADLQLKDQGKEAEEILKGMMDDYQKANEQYKILIETANDQAVSSTERERRRKSAETKLVEIKELETNVRQYRNTTQAALEEKTRRMRDGILGEIREKINEKARAENFSLVIDVAAETINQTPVILFNSGQHDLTDAILSAVNAGAPPGLLPPANR
jgi:outer membrane protein